MAFPRFRFSFVFCIALISQQRISAGDIHYRVSTADKSDRLAVEMDIPVSSSSLDVQMPSWSPGLYVLENYWNQIRNVSASDESGRELQVFHPKNDTWSVETRGIRRVKIRYERPIVRTTSRMGMFASDERAVHYGGPTVYMYVVGRKDEPCTLDFEVPVNWKVAVSLKETGKSIDHRGYTAKNYDVLADCPVTMVDYVEDRYILGGKEYILAYRGAAQDKVNRAKAVEICRFISRSESDFFGRAPFDRYVWHLWVSEGRDGAGGVEHATSSQDFVAIGLGPGALAGLAHEFFHLWNVKRIRSSVLGPFDYTQLPKTGALWWLEGVTDYYAHLLPYRNGAWGRDKFLSDAVGQVREVRRNPARLEVSPYDAGFRIPEATTSFSSGYRVNYYPTGWVLGMIFDIELRARTNGRRCLDDVERALWNLCKNDKPGFQEEEIRKQLIRFGGAEMGRLYDQWVMKPGELPVEQQLAKMGMELDEKTAGTNGRPGIIKVRPDISTSQRALLEGWLTSKPAVSLGL